MARLLGPTEIPVISMQDIIDFLPDDSIFTIAEGSQIWVIPNTTTMIQLMVKTTGFGGAIALTEREDINPGTQGFEIGNLKYDKPICILMIKGRITLNDDIYTHFFIAAGDHIALKGFIDAADNSPHIRIKIGEEEVKSKVTPIVPIKMFETITTPTPHGYNTTEFGLFSLYNLPTESRETKVITTCLFLFPYIKNIIKNFVTIIDYKESVSSMDPIQSGIGRTGSQIISGEQLSLLTLFILGPAYSLDIKLNEQISRRVKAAAASMQLTTLSAQDMGGLINRVGWRAGDISPIVDDVLAAVICIKEDMKHDPEASLTQLASGAWLKQHASITDVAVELLEQARLVYKNYHATSISFVPMVIPQINQTLGAENVIFHTEITRFNEIKEIVLNSPYMGLRSKLPEKFHIKNFPKLVYCALKYHEASLTDPIDINAFKMYKVGEIKNHITNIADQRLVEDAAAQLPAPTIAAIAQLVRSLPLDLGIKLMDKKTEAERKEVLMILRGDTNKGAWAEMIIAREDAELQRVLVREATRLLSDLSVKRFELAREQADLIQDPAIRRERLKAITDWKNQILRQIEDLQPWEISLTEAVSPSQSRIRNQLIESIRQITTLLDAPPGLTGMEID